MIKKINIKNVILNTKHNCIVLDFSNYTNEDEFLDDFCSKLKNDSIVILKSNSEPKRMVFLGQKIRQLCSYYDSLFLIEDRLDIAKIIDADGVVLNKNSYSIENSKKILDSQKFYAYFLDDTTKIQDVSGFDFLISTNNEIKKEFLDNFKIFLENNYDNK